MHAARSRPEGTHQVLRALVPREPDGTSAGGVRHNAGGLRLRNCLGYAFDVARLARGDRHSSRRHNSQLRIIILLQVPMGIDTLRC